MEATLMWVTMTTENYLLPTIEQVNKYSSVFPNMQEVDGESDQWCILFSDVLLTIQLESFYNMIRDCMWEEADKQYVDAGDYFECAKDLLGDSIDVWQTGGWKIKEIIPRKNGYYDTEEFDCGGFVLELDDTVWSKDNGS